MLHSTASRFFQIILLVCFAQIELNGAEVELGNKEIAELWKSFSEVNRIWLDPSPNRISYTVTATPINDDRITESVNRVWLDGEKARWEMDVRKSNQKELLRSYALVINGDKESCLRGPEQLLNKQRPARDIHALRQGISWNTALHAVYRNGLPEDSRIVERRTDADSEIVVVELDLGKERSSVGLGLFHLFHGQANCRIDRVRLHINVTDMIPLLEEYVDRNFKIDYSGEFLQFGEQRAPSKIRHISKHFRDNSDWILEGHFQKVNDHWMLDKALNIQNGKVVSEFLVGNVSTKDIDASTFDLAIATPLVDIPTTTSLADEVVALKARVELLEERLATLEEPLKPLIAKAKVEKFGISQQLLARKRMRLDRTKYSRDELQEIEALYQVANKNWGTEEAQESLRKLVNKYDEANRTGCAVLYLGQMSSGSEQVDHLKTAIEKFGECFYGDGVRVGAYARYVLGETYLDEGKPKRAKELFDEIRNGFPDAIDHKGNSLVAILPK